MNGQFLDELISQQAKAYPRNIACLECNRAGDRSVDYLHLEAQVSRVALGLQQRGLQSGDRVVVVADKRLETIYSLFGAARAGLVFVPVNPGLTAEQARFIVDNCRAKTLIASSRQLSQLDSVLSANSLAFVVDNSSETKDPVSTRESVVTWQQLTGPEPGDLLPHQHDTHALAAIIYTSGSTGKPKGVMLSHQNILTGAACVATYLENTPQDNLLLILPLSFDYGFSQLTTAFSVGARLTMLEYLLPRDVLNTVQQHSITGLAAVPHVWNKLARLDWTEESSRSLRYLTSTGGAMPVKVTEQLATRLPGCKIYLMFGLTEAFRSTFLPPEQVATRPASIGKAIPCAQVDVVREDGTPCAAGEPGEIVHTGPLVAAGYWENAEATGERFRLAPQHMQSGNANAVWSGDLGRRDAEGYIYHIGRRDDMIKSYGYRVSPTEIEEVVYQYPGVVEAVAFGIPDDSRGQSITVAIRTKTITPGTKPGNQPGQDESAFSNELIDYCKQKLPAHMVPDHVMHCREFAKNANGKVDRKVFIEHRLKFANPD